jgi:hypothetical protein
MKSSGIDIKKVTKPEFDEEKLKILSSAGVVIT